MNTRPNATTVLCYGDSNTWGQKPDKTGRYAADKRWTGILQNKLGEDYYIIEEGLSSRTTDLEYEKKPGRNGRTYLSPCVESHNPLDVVIIMLGTNDFKAVYNRTAKEVADALAKLVDDVKSLAYGKNNMALKIILVSPILIDSNAPRFAEFYTGSYDERSMHESEKLAAEVERIAKDGDCIFVDAASIAKPGEDGIHFSPDSGKPLAELLAQTIKSNL